MKVERLEEEWVGEQFRRDLRLRWGEVKKRVRLREWRGNEEGYGNSW